MICVIQLAAASTLKSTCGSRVWGLGRVRFDWKIGCLFCAGGCFRWVCCNHRRAVCGRDGPGGAVQSALSSLLTHRPPGPKGRGVADRQRGGCISILGQVFSMCFQFLTVYLVSHCVFSFSLCFQFLTVFSVSHGFFSFSGYYR